MGSSSPLKWALGQPHGLLTASTWASSYSTSSESANDTAASGRECSPHGRDWAVAARPWGGYIQHSCHSSLHGHNDDIHPPLSPGISPGRIRFGTHGRRL